ncbi:acid phosphatase 1-like [Mercurialis annua]|uniref:acid phosphatase 1-like n=1 Tax=Mercurialis annua TaxID=3986 RepID=UPI00215FF9FD|nr:acid phosphatase 1-like [Mercurialis annua]
MTSSSSSSISLTLLLFTFLPLTLSQSTIQIPAARKTWSKDDGLYCSSWRLSVETNNAGYWVKPPARCESYVEDYMTAERYLSDSEVVAADSISFAKSVNVTGDGKDAWVFDIDETLLSNLPYYEVRFGQPYDEKSYDQWVNLAKAPALPSSLNLYKELKRLGFTIFLLTGRSEHQRNSTSKNLLFAGYNDWERLFLRGVTDQGKTAIVYKSEKRMELVKEGYKIHGNSGDQWSDLLGFAVAKRSFKLPNPLYYLA